MSKVAKENAMLVDIQYVRQDRQKGLDDCLYTIYKDVKTGEKFVEKFERPKVPIYIKKDAYRTHSYSTEYAKKEELTPKIVEYNQIPFEIAKEMGDQGKQLLQNIRETGNYKNMRMLNLWPYAYGQDYDVRSYYRFAWAKQMEGKSPMKLRKGFMDIETDILSSPGRPRPKKDPVDLVTVIDGEKQQVYTFLLVGREYFPLNPRDQARISISDEERRNLYAKRKEAEEEILADPQSMIDEVHKEFDAKYPGFEYHLYFYTDEAKMITHLFQCIKKISPDFMMIWNISFDIPYLMERMEALGLDPAHVICDEEFPNRVCVFHKDNHNFEIKNKTDHFEVSSKTVYLCQMENYASIRKGGDELREYRLDYVAKKECDKAGKYVYSDEATIKTLGYVNLRRYILYNIKDVLLQYGIEDTVRDIDNIYRTSYNNLTPYESVGMQTVVLRNVQYKFYDSQGLVPGANTNKIFVQMDREAHPEKYAKKGKKEPGIEGALVGNTRIINPFGQKLYGKKTNFIFLYSIDMDMKSFYPSTIILMNISKSTLIFKVCVQATNYDVRGGEIPFHGFTDVELVETNPVSFTGDIAAEIFDNFQCGNILSTGRKFMNLPSISELVHEIKKKGVAVA